jgi:uncharacterized radical SAM protein YgiQ
MERRGWDCCDFIFVSGDAYGDHPSFAVAVVSRVLEDAGFRVGIIPQPDWEDPGSYTVLGRPRLAFLAGAGNMDSMVAHYTAAKKKRSQDAYSPGGKAGLRPDRAILKYAEGIRRCYKNIPLIIGGIEASLRCFAHYDYWSDRVRRSILLDSKADILVYGMGERAIREIARRLDQGEAIGAIRNVRGTCVRFHGPQPDPDSAAGDAQTWVRLPDYEAVSGEEPPALRAYAEHFMLQRQNADPLSARTLAERTGPDRWVIRNPPAFPLKPDELDRVYELPYLRRAHPMYDAAGGIPAMEELTFSQTASRGCFGGCSFCAITFHQGRAVSSRSRESLLREARLLMEHRDFKGYIHDVGGPTANFYGPPCEKQARGGFCPDRECLYPRPCPRLKADHGPYLAALKALRELAPQNRSGEPAKSPKKSSKSPVRGQGLKKVFIRSGIRFDYIALDKARGREFLETLCRFHVSGQLKVAPEHIAPEVLAAMGKGGGGVYETFKAAFTEINRRLGRKQYLIPYFMSSHPGAGLTEAIELAQYLKKDGFIPDQVQDFYPTPGTLSTVMYRTGLDPRTMEPLFVARGEGEKRLQRALLQCHRPEFRALVIKQLRRAGREDLLRALMGGT